MFEVFITGTDTNVGKTYVTELISKHLLGCGFDVSVMKPISTGLKKDNDAVHLKKALKLKDPISLINPVNLRLPLAPYTASKLLNKPINLKKIFTAFNKLKEKHKIVIVEGIGGVFVPIKKNYFVKDLIKDLNIPVIIIAKAGLGTINHTLLTIETLKKQNIKILGVIMNGYKGNDLSEKTNVGIIREITKLPILGLLKHKSKFF